MTGLAATESRVFTRAARSEWIKLRTLRSTALAVVLTIVAMAVLAAVTATNTSNLNADTTSNLLAGVLLGQIVFGVLGVLAATGEYSSGLIRTTLTVLPHRHALFTAKAVVVGGAALVAGEVATFAAYFVGRPWFSSDITVGGLGDPGVLRAVSFSGAYLALVALIGLGLGTAVRHGPAAITGLVGVLFVLPLVPFGRSVARFLPEMIAANSLSAVQPVRGFTYAPWVELCIVAAYAVVALVAGGAVLYRRDA
jgi:ABC-2 type transport system permease protein